METVQLMGTTIPSPTGTGTATTVDGSHYVMLHNSGTTLRETVVQLHKVELPYQMYIHRVERD